MPDRYEALRAALARRDEGGRRWTWTASGRDGSGGYPQTVIREGDVVLICTCYDTPDEPAFTAPYIAAADPPTVRALLDERDAWRALGREQMAECAVSEDEGCDFCRRIAALLEDQ